MEDGGGGATIAKMVSRRGPEGQVTATNKKGAKKVKKV